MKNNKYSEESNSSNSRGDTGGKSPLNGPETPLGPGGIRAPVSSFFPASPEGPLLPGDPDAPAGPAGSGIPEMPGIPAAQHDCIFIYKSHFLRSA